jgi:hypothetical protein
MLFQALSSREKFSVGNDDKIHRACIPMNILIGKRLQRAGSFEGIITDKVEFADIALRELQLETRLPPIINANNTIESRDVENPYRRLRKTPYRVQRDGRGIVTVEVKNITVSNKPAGVENLQPIDVPDTDTTVRGVQETKTAFSVL